MKKLILVGVVVTILALTILLATSPVGKAVVKRAQDRVGLAKLTRAYEAKPGSTATFTADPSRAIAWVDLDESGGLGVGDGPDGSWSTDCPRGGIVGFADGSTAGLSHIEITGHGGVVTVSP